MNAITERRVRALRDEATTASGIAGAALAMQHQMRISLRGNYRDKAVAIDLKDGIAAMERAIKHAQQWRLRALRKADRLEAEAGA